MTEEYRLHTHTNKMDDCVLSCTHKTSGDKNWICRWVEELSYCPLHTPKQHSFAREMGKYMSVKNDNTLSRDVLNDE